MTADWVAAISSLATFVVIAASAGAAVVQLRHARNSNQLSVFSEFRRHFESDEFRKAFRLAVDEVPNRSGDPEFRKDLFNPDSENWAALRELLNYLDYTGALVKNGIVDRTLACDLFYTQVVQTWEGLREFIATLRARRGYRTWEDFEYLYLECLRFRKRYPDGTFPRGYGVAELPEPWADMLVSKENAAP